MLGHLHQNWSFTVNTLWRTCHAFCTHTLALAHIEEVCNIT
jgi:hypothetical protein